VCSWHCVDSQVSALWILGIGSKVSAAFCCCYAILLNKEWPENNSSEVPALFCYCAILLNEEWPENELILGECYS
jgi:hypothetical protein